MINLVKSFIEHKFSYLRHMASTDARAGPQIHVYYEKDLCESHSSARFRKCLVTTRIFLALKLGFSLGW